MSDFNAPHVILLLAPVSELSNKLLKLADELSHSVTIFKCRLKKEKPRLPSRKAEFMGLFLLLKMMGNMGVHVVSTWVRQTVCSSTSFVLRCSKHPPPLSLLAGQWSYERRRAHNEPQVVEIEPHGVRSMSSSYHIFSFYHTQLVQRLQFRGTFTQQLM